MDAKPEVIGLHAGVGYQASNDTNVIPINSYLMQYLNCGKFSELGIFGTSNSKDGDLLVVSHFTNLIRYQNSEAL